MLGESSAAPRWPMEKSVLRNGPVHWLSVLQRPVLHLVDEIKRPRPDLRLARQHDVVGKGGTAAVNSQRAAARAERWRMGMGGTSNNALRAALISRSM